MTKENTKIEKVITRFAPSPTGFMHVGGVRTALYAWLFARKHNGTFILRIEDTDKEREVIGSIEHIIESLNWIGIDYDEGPNKEGSRAPYIQSERLEHYKKYAEKLIEKGFAYPDPYTEEELADFRKIAEEKKEAFLYRNHRPEVFEKWDGKKPLRFCVKNIKRYEWDDVVFGKLSAGPEALDDFVLIKSDGYPTYNFAHIIDDLEMGVTHIMRAQEFISSVPKFLSLYEALEITPPIFVTLPPILAPDGKKKLSKRDGAKDILDYKNEGYLPSAFMNFLAFLGWNPGTEQEIFTKDELIKSFDISKIGHTGAHFNEEKLMWVNKEHLKILSYEDQESFIVQYLTQSIKSLPHFTNDMLHKITPIIMERISTGLDVEMMCVNGDIEYFFTYPNLKLDLLKKEEKLEGDTVNHLQQIISSLSSLDEQNWTKDQIKEILWDYATERGRGAVLWPMRYALSGREKSPDPFTLAEIFEKDGTIERLSEALNKIKNV